MNTNEHESTGGKIVFKDEVYQIVGAAIEVANTLGHGFLEKPYERALAKEMKLRGLPFSCQPRYAVSYKGEIVGEYVPDIIAYGTIIVETKTIERITSKERSQVLNYLRATECKVGLILNFGNPKLEWERIVL